MGDSMIDVMILGGGRLGACFSLILIDQPSEIKQAFEQAATCFNIPLVIIESAKTGGTALWQNTIILVRPDEFVAYAASDLGSDDSKIAAKAILRKAVGYT
jgi:4-hydroxyisophthalate hydroxylase